MARKRLTEVFPFLIPLRLLQRKKMFFIKQKFDGNKYAEKISGELPFTVFELSADTINKNTGRDIAYQYNKAHNLKLASKCINGMLIEPGETFSLLRGIRNAEKNGKYKDGLMVVNGKLIHSKGGGLCQLSNMIFFSALHTPLEVIERTGHRLKEFPDGDGCIKGVDATISEGWIDLKIKNTTDRKYQICVDFTDEYRIRCRILSDSDDGIEYTVKNENETTLRKNGKIIEEVDVVRLVKRKYDGETVEKRKLYRNVSELGYEPE